MRWGTPPVSAVSVSGSAVPVVSVLTGNRDIPFALTRQFLQALFGPDLPPGLAIPLRPVLPPPRPAEPVEAERRLKSQLRFYTRARVMRDFRGVAWAVGQRHPDGLVVEVPGQLHGADHDFFSTLVAHGGVELRVHSGPADPTPATPNPHDQTAAEAHELLSHPGDPGGRGDQYARTVSRLIGRYLRCGDSWTAAWLADAVRDNNAELDATAADAMALAYLLQERTAEAELLLRPVAEVDDLAAARACYTLAMLASRHHPRIWRDANRAERLLDRGWQILSRLPEDTDPHHERALNRNGMALVRFRRGEAEAAATLLESALAGLPEPTPDDDGGHGAPVDVYRSVLQNNLGRVLASLPGEDFRAERALRAATGIDPGFAEFWLDLVTFLSERDRLDEAEVAARMACQTSTAVAAAPALVGYLRALAGDHHAAATNYARAAEMDPGRTEFLLAAAREACAAEDYPTTRTWLARLRPAELSADEAAEAELLALEVEINSGPLPPPTQVAASLEELARRYPDSQLVRDNLAAVRRSTDTGAGRVQA